MQRALHNSSCWAVKCLVIPGESVSLEEAKDLLPPSEALQQTLLARD